MLVNDFNNTSEPAKKLHKSQTVKIGHADLLILLEELPVHDQLGLRQLDLLALLTRPGGLQLNLQLKYFKTYSKNKIAF